MLPFIPGSGARRKVVDMRERDVSTWLLLLSDYLTIRMIIDAITNPRMTSVSGIASIMMIEPAVSGFSAIAPGSCCTNP